MKKTITSILFFALAIVCNAQNTPIMGWSSWNTYHVNISDSLIRRQADALVSQGLKDVGYNYINIDDGFFGHRDAEGRMVAHEGRFPQGMKVVADYIHSLGLKAGIYAEADERESGITIHHVSKQIDSGEIIHQATCEVRPDDTPESLASRIHQLEYQHYPQVIEQLIK